MWRVDGEEIAKAYAECLSSKKKEKKRRKRIGRYPISETLDMHIIKPC